MTVQGALGYAAAFSACVILLLEVNAPQFRYFAGQLDKQEYLREALLTYRSLEAVAEHAAPGDQVFGLQNCSVAYAPDPDRFNCNYHDPADPAQVEDLARQIRGLQTRYLILPAEPASANVLSRLAPEASAESVFADSHYDVYRLTWVGRR